LYEKEVLEVYKHCGVKSFPVDCEMVFRMLGYEVLLYKQVADKDINVLRKMNAISHDGYTVPSELKVYINGSQYRSRQRFTLAHELGHLIMFTKDEDVANAFASSFLAPRPIIFARQFRTADELVKAFGISYKAANHALIHQMYVPSDDGFAMIDYFRERSSCPWPYNTKTTIQFTSLPWEAAPAPDPDQVPDPAPAPAPAPVQAKSDQKKPPKAADPVMVADIKPNPERDARIEAMRKRNLRQMKRIQRKMREREEFMDSLPESVRRRYAAQRSMW